MGGRAAAGQPFPDQAGEDPEPVRENSGAAAPAWFAMLIGPPVERHELAVVVDGRTIGTVEIVSEPRDEIAEVWENTIALAAVGPGPQPVFVCHLHHLARRSSAPPPGPCPRLPRPWEPRSHVVL